MLPGWTAVIVNYNGASYLEACLAALLRCQLPPHDVVVIDNASTDDSLQELHGFPRVNVLPLRRNLGFAGGANVGLAAVETELALLLNPDVEVDEGFGTQLLHAFEADQRLGAVGALLRYPDRMTIQHAGGVIERPLMTTRHLGYGSINFESFSLAKDVEFVTGGAMGLRMSAFRQTGGFDEQFAPVYYEDVDLCVRLRDAGWRVCFEPTLEATHHEGVTLQQRVEYFRFLHRNRIRFAVKHLSHDEWSNAFAPAEFARLRYELSTLNGDDWADRSGSGALEVVLRGIDAADGWEAPSLLDGPSPNALAPLLDEMRIHVRVEGEPLTSSIPGLGWLRNAINNLGPRWYIDRALAKQREFNTAVVLALEVQDELNRERTAQLFLLAIDAIGRLHQLASQTGDPQPE